MRLKRGGFRLQRPVSTSKNLLINFLDILVWKGGRPTTKMYRITLMDRVSTSELPCRTIPLATGKVVITGIPP
jgi:hypothetical protein